VSASLWEVLQSPVAQIVMLLAIAAVLAVVGFYFVGKLRGDIADDEPASSNLMTKFKELHARGGLSDEEYRTIKTKLAAQLQEELRDSDEKG
jgi:uncharacterized membrane protein